MRFCFLFCEIETTGPPDGFCQNYEAVLRSKADSAQLKRLSGPMRKYVERNEVLYRCTCKGWKNPICEKTK